MIDDNSEFYDSLKEVATNVLQHYGTPRHSGRYPWGSGDDPYQNHTEFLKYVDDLKKQGLSQRDIYKGMGLKSSTELRAKMSIATNAIRAADASRARILRDKGMSLPAIGRQMGKNESTIRSLLDPNRMRRTEVLQNTVDFIKATMETPGHRFLDVGAGTEHYLNGISDDKKKVALQMLVEEGYKIRWLKVPQQGVPGKFTNMKILIKPDDTFTDVVNNKDDIGTLTGYSEDGGETIKAIVPPKSVDSNRIAVRYGPEGGAAKDGVIELSRHAADLSLGGKRYAQVRIAVDDSHYLKGMAMYADNMPDGVDIIFNTNKKNTGNKLDAMKGLKDDADNPFGSIVRQRTYIDADGNEQLSPLNRVGENGNEEGTWNTWSRNFSSQFLSKQSPKLAKQQLDLSYEILRQEYDEISALTNPAVKRKLLEEFADGADSDAKHLKAAGLPRTRSQVILPIESLKDHEIYAPNFNNGEKVVLVRHPHAGTFEIPELTVNNRNREALKVLKQAEDAVGINPNVAERLSGADFDGDTVLVIPNPNGMIKSRPALQALKGFDPKGSYPPYDGMKTIDGGTWDAAKGEVDYGLKPDGSPKKPNGKQKQRLMGEVSNLITDMTIRGANENEIARAAAHSMVVIDAEKHSLNYKQSEKDYNIAALRKEYQKGIRGGASTLISKAKNTTTIDARRPQRINEFDRDRDTGEKINERKTVGAINPKTGELMWSDTGEGYYKPVKQKDGSIKEVWQPRQERVAKMDLTNDAFTLSSGTTMEAVYATHANRLKKMANEARLQMINTVSDKQNTTARTTYAKQVEELAAGLKVAQSNAPLERKAQLVAESQVSARIDANPGLDAAEVKKIRSIELNKARGRLGAGKTRIEFNQEQWNAVQAGAISNNMLEKILANADMDSVREFATPREKKGLTDAKLRLAASLMNSGYTQSEIAERLGVSVSAIQSGLAA